MVFLHGQQLASTCIQSFRDEGQLGGVRCWPWLDTKCSPIHFITPLNWTGKRKYSESLAGWKITHKWPLPANQTKLRKVHLIYWQIRVGNWEIKQFFSHLSLLPWVQLYSWFPNCTSFPSSVAQEDGEWGLQSVCHTLSVLLWVLMRRIHTFPMWAVEPLLWPLEHVLPLHLHWPWCLQGCSSHAFSVPPYLPAIAAEEWRVTLFSS